MKCRWFQPVVQKRGWWSDDARRIQRSAEGLRETLRARLGWVLANVLMQPTRVFSAGSVRNAQEWHCVVVSGAPQYSTFNVFRFDNPMLANPIDYEP